LTLRHRLRAVCARDFLFPVGIIALVLVTAFVPQSPLRDAVTHGNVSGMRIAISGAYAILSPFCAMLDMQSLLTVPQHISVLVTLLIGFCVWRLVANTRSESFPVWRREIAGLLLVVIVAPALLLLVNVLAPRPMARLQVDDPDVVVVDVHTHTASSHDGRPDWTQARVREWHRASGYNVAYITDHKRFGGAIDALASNPARAGDDVVLFSGLELRSGGQHVNVLSMTPAESTYIVDGDHLTHGIRLRDGRAPLIVQTIPFTLSQFAGPGQDTLPITRAIELNDGAPRGLTTGLRLHAELLRLADSLNLALVAGSDNHGWGNTASGWTLVRVPGWRSLTPAALAAPLETAMLGGRHATSVVERRTPLLFSVPQLALTIPVMFVSAARGLTPPERVSWIAWSWTTLLVRIGVRRAAYRSLVRARLARRRRRERMRIVPIRTVAGLQS
jgi:predicted metal-dependent phosphoesterase TrpH